MSTTAEPASGPLRRDQRGAGAEEDVEHELAAPGDVLDGIGDKRRRLDRRVQRQVLAPAAGHRVHRGVVPDVGAVAAVPAELDGVEVGRVPDPLDQDQLVLRAVERSHAGVRLVPDAEIEEIAVDRPADRGRRPRRAASRCRRSAPRRRAKPGRRRRGCRRGSSGTPPRPSRPRPWRTRGADPWRWHGR